MLGGILKGDTANKVNAKHTIVIGEAIAINVNLVREQKPRQA